MTMKLPINAKRNVWLKECMISLFSGIKHFLNVKDCEIRWVKLGKGTVVKILFLIQIYSRCYALLFTSMYNLKVFIGLQNKNELCKWNGGKNASGLVRTYFMSTGMQYFIMKWVLSILLFCGKVLLFYMLLFEFLKTLLCSWVPECALFMFRWLFRVPLSNTHRYLCVLR